MKTLLSVNNVKVTLPSTEGYLRALGQRDTVLDNITFALDEGEIMGLVGESGSGKSMIALTIMQLLKDGGRVEEGEILFEGKNLAGLPDEELCRIRGKKIAMIFQEPMTSLNPVLTIGEQVAEPLRIHESLPEEEVHERVKKALEDAGLQDTNELIHKYPHELSGGMRQRVMIAIAMITRPEVLIADEPTTALDVVIQEQILSLLQKINQKYGTAILLISHDLNVIRRICTTVGVLYRGKLLEEGPLQEVFEHPKEDYTKTLVAHLPRQDHEPQEEILLHVEDLSAYYEERAGVFGKKQKTEILHGISFDVKKGEILGIVGESGSGKSSLARVLTGLNHHYSGSFTFAKDPKKKESGASSMETAGSDTIRPQMVFQDPFGSLNPVHSVGWMMKEALYRKKDLSGKEKREEVIRMLEAVGLSEAFYERMPSELSGGQRQRISIGTALLYGSPFLIADEAVSALDVTVQSQILSLLVKLQKEKDLTILFITHDMSIVESICHRVIVLLNGSIVEEGDVKEVLNHPKHSYTKILMEAGSLSKAAANDLK